MATGATWLLLHGTPLTPRVWDGVRPYLERGGEVLTPSLPRPGSGPVRAQTDIARQVLSRLDPAASPVHVVGHSYGGQVAVEMALAVPQRVASLTVLCSRVSPFPAFAPVAEGLRRGEPLDSGGALSRWFMPAELAAGGPLIGYARDCLDDADRQAWADDLAAIATYDRLAALPAIAVPTTVIAAEHDQVGTPPEMQSMASNIPGATFACLAGASHMSPFLDPEALANRLSSA